LQRVVSLASDGNVGSVTATDACTSARIAPRAARTTASAQLCRVVAEDHDLSDALSPARRSGAIQQCLAPTISLPRGHWDGQHNDMEPDGIGLLLLSGLVIRRVSVEGGYGAELLGQGDLLRPWQGEGAQSTLCRTSGWRVLEQARIAVLDASAAVRLAQYPELTGRLVAKALERSRNLAVAMAIARHKRLEVRLHMLFWHLADRWGRVRPDGVVVPLRLTHSMLGDLVSAQRPSVSTGLSALARQGLLHNSRREWILCGDPPGELLQVQSIRVVTNERQPTNGSD
jgi:CRP/FNR family transcriptional regulator, cyclic AMP receptor protein